MFPWSPISSLGSHSCSPDYGVRLEYLWSNAQRGRHQLDVSPVSLPKQQNKSHITSDPSGLYVEDRQMEAERLPSTLMITNEWADGISGWSYWDVKTRSEFMYSPFMRLEGEQWLTNECTPVCLHHPLKIIMRRKLSCAYFVNEVQTAGSKTLKLLGIWFLTWLCSERRESGRWLRRLKQIHTLIKDSL